MDWNILGIEATKDKKAITAAYRTMLKSVNPEDKPEEFKALRAAYEEALRLADNEEKEPERDESPLGLWKERIRELYDDFAARIDPEKWRALLNDDVCIALDKRPAAEEALLKFLMQDFYLPQSVWQVMDSVFAWSERKQELYENYPRDFIDYAVMNGITLPANLPYELFKPGKSAKDCDEYRRIYYQINRGTLEEIPPLLDKIEALSEWHPYGEALRCRLMIENGDADKAREGYKRLAGEYPDDNVLVMAWAAQCMNTEQYEEAERLTRHVLELIPEHWNAKHMLADSLEKQGKPEDAKELIFDLMRAAGGDQKQLYHLGQVVNRLNETIITQKEDAYKADPSDDKNAIELSWCYLQNDRNEDALRLCEGVSEDYEERYDYHNLAAKVNYACENYDKALFHLVEIEKILRAMRPDGTEKTDKRIKRLPEMLQMQGSCLLTLGRKAEGLKKYEEALAMAPDDAEVLTKTAHILRAEKDFSRAVEVLERLIEVKPHSYHGYLLLAMNLFDLRRDRDALDAVNRALELESGDLGSYILKIRIFIRNGVWDGAKDVIKYVREHGVTDDISLLWCEGQVAEFADEDREKALELYREVAKRAEGGEYFAWGEKLYFRLTVLTADGLDMRNSEHRDKLMALLEKGLGYNSEDPDCLDYKAWLLKRDKRFDESLKIYLKLEKLPRRDMSVEREIAEIYYNNLNKNAKKALEYYQKLIDNEEHPDLYFYSGTCRRYLRLFDEAERDFLREQELAPDDIDGYNGLAFVYEAMGRNEDALAQVNKVIEIVDKREGDQSRFYMHKLRVLRRLGRPKEAIETIDAMEKKYGRDDADKLRFDIYCQFGMWKEVEKNFLFWKFRGKKRERIAACEIYYDLYRGRIDKARKAVEKGEKKLGSDEYEELRLTIAELDGDAEAALKIWRNRAANRNEKSHELMNMAEVFWRCGRTDKAAEYAKAALEVLDRVLEGCVVDEALYRGRRSLVLAMLGREAEARKELALVRTLPLCEHCDYCRCKDADIFEALMEGIFGNHELALELSKTGKENWPDEMDFVSEQRYLERKGY